jgi:hypothetical protein
MMHFASRGRIPIIGIILYAFLTPAVLVGAEPNPHNCETDNGNGLVCNTQVSKE